MAILKRVFFFALVNILVLTTLTIAWSFISPILLPALGIDPNGAGGYYSYLLVFSLVFGMGGAFISLLMSKWMAKRMFNLQMIEANTSNPEMAALYQTVDRLAKQAGLPKTPEVGIYDSPEVNAFATGPSRKNSLVAVSTGLLRNMDKGSVDGVLGHEVAHIANGDMVTMTLIQGIINALVIFFARIVANLIASSMDEKVRPFAHLGIVIGLQILFSILGSLVVNAFSRWREYRADVGGAKLAGRENMIRALQSLKGQPVDLSEDQAAIASLKISGKAKSILGLFSTHPSLEDRIKALESARI